AWDIAKPDQGQTHEPTKVGLPDLLRGELITVLEGRNPLSHRVPGVPSEPGPGTFLRFHWGHATFQPRRNAKAHRPSKPRIPQMYRRSRVLLTPSGRISRLFPEGVNPWRSSRGHSGQKTPAGFLFRHRFFMTPDIMASRYVSPHL